MRSRCGCSYRTLCWFWIGSDRIELDGIPNWPTVRMWCIYTTSKQNCALLTPNRIELNQSNYGMEPRRKFELNWTDLFRWLVGPTSFFFFFRKSYSAVEGSTYRSWFRNQRVNVFTAPFFIQQCMMGCECTNLAALAARLGQWEFGIGPPYSILNLSNLRWDFGWTSQSCKTAKSASRNK